MNGITFYDEAPSGSQPTLTELLAGMTAQQKLAVLDGYANRNNRGNKPLSLTALKHEQGIPIAVGSWLYAKIEEIEQAMKLVQTGNNDQQPPFQNGTDLLTWLKSLYSSDQTGDPNQFNDSQVEAVANKVIDMSKFDGSGTWSYYRDNVSL